MLRLRRFLGWAIFFGFLGAVGGGVFHLVRYRPRCVIEGLPSHLHLYLSADGSRLGTLEWTEAKAGRGPWGAWNTHNGRMVHGLFDDAMVVHFEVSPDRRHLAAMLNDGSVRLVDWLTGEEQRLPVERVRRHFAFSPKGRWLFVGAAHEMDSNLADRQFVFNVATKQLVLQLEETCFHSGDEQSLFVRKWGESEMTIWDLNSGKNTRTLPIEATRIVVDADHRSLAVSHMGHSGIEVWDLQSSQLRFARETGLMAPTWELSPDGQFIALVNDGAQTNLEMIEIATGRTLWKHETRPGRECKFSSDSSLCCLRHWHGPGDVKVLTMFDVASGRMLWERASDTPPQFAGDAAIMLHQEPRNVPPEFLDAHTGRSIATAPIDVDGWQIASELTPDRRHVLLHGRQSRRRAPYFWEAWLENRWPDVFGDHVPAVSVLETATGRELLRILRHGSNSRQLSDDASTLLTVDAADGDAENRFIARIWDVRPTKAYLSAIAAAMGMGVVLLALNRLRRKLSGRVGSSPAGQPPSALA